MRINIFHTVPGERRVSMEVYANELSAALSRLDEGLAVTDITVPSRFRIRFRRVPTGSRLGGYVDRYVCYQLAARATAADVNHIVDHGYGHLTFSTEPRRTVVTFQDATLLKMKAGELPVNHYPWFSVLGHQLSLAGIRRAARVIVPSLSSRSDFLRFVKYPPERVCVVPHGVAEHFRPLGHRGTLREFEPRRAPRLLHVGHCGPTKNIEGVIRALPRIGAKLGRMPELIKVGGKFTPAQRELISRGRLEKHIRHLGVVDLAELPQIYADADVLVMPSLYEGFGLPVLEAMACGTVVVASNRAALPEVVGDAGILVEPTDPDSIAEGVTRVLNDASFRKGLRARGMERAQQFSWKRSARATFSVYQQVHANLG